MTGVKLVNDATALLSMRESDFDTYSAYGEAIDNSIQADAKNIHLKFETLMEARGYERITKVAFVDDGDGMDPDIIHRCLQLGYSSRFNDRKGIGRFGVGMTLGAIHECMRVDVFSKTGTSSDWLTTNIDLTRLDMSNDSSQVDIPDPVTKAPPNWLNELIPEESGTAVIWSDYDRQVDTASKVIDGAKIWIGRTFRKFIWEGVSIYVNGQKVFAIDPLYVNTDFTQHPKDPKAAEVEAIVIPWPVPQDVAEFVGQKSDITVRLTLLPKEFRLKQGAGNSAETSERHIDENQGISITRLRREVFYGPIPYWPGTNKWFSEIDRWWGCEVEFSPLLDRSFTVKNIKRGAVPNKELKKVIFEKIDPTVQSFLEQVREKWAAEKLKRQREEEAQNTHRTGHEGAEGVVKKTPADQTSKEIDDPKKAERELLERLKRDRTAEEEEARVTKWRDQPYTIEEDRWKGMEFMELKPLGGNDVLLYNKSHPFMAHLQELIKELSEEDDSRSKALAKELKCLIDLLLISFCKAESKFTNDKNAEILEMMRFNWGLYLKSYLRNLNEETD